MQNLLNLYVHEFPMVNQITALPVTILATDPTPTHF